MLTLDQAKLRSEMDTRLSELVAREMHLFGDLSTELSADLSEQAIEIEDDASLEAQDALVRRRMVALRAAISRIDAGQYGQCTRCGKPISEARLKAFPEAALCIACAT